MSKITRMIDVELRASEDNENNVEGLACVFDKETDLGYFYEKIDRHAFDNCDMSDVFMLFNHDQNFVLARTLNNSLRLSVEDSGLYQQSNIVATTQGNDVFKLVRDGLINKMSFAFSVDREGETWYVDEDNKEHRTITKIAKLYDVSLVTYPAYEATSAMARSVSEMDELAKAHFEERANMENIEKVEEVVEAVEERAEVTEEVIEAVEEVAETVEEPKTEETVEERENMNMNFEVEARNANDYVESAEYRSAWVKAVVGKGDADLNAIKEARGLSTASATMVPTYVADKIEATWERNRLLGLVSVTYSTAKLSFPVETANSGAGFHTEGAEAPAEEEITLVEKLLQPRTMKKWISITDELIESGEVAVMDYIADEVVYYIMKAINSAIINGTLASGKGIEGIVNSNLANAVNAGALDATTFYKGLATLIDVENPVLVMNPTDFYTKVMGLMDTTGHPIYSAVNGEDFVAGCSVLLQASVPTNTAIVGDLSAFRLELEGASPRIIFDPYTSAKEDKVIVVGKMLTAGAVTKANKLAVVTFTA